MKSPFGYHIIVVEEKKPAQVATLANAHDKIKALLQQQQEQQQVPAFLANLRSKANIVVLDSALKDALPPAGPVPGAGAASPGAAPAPNTSTSP